MKKTDIELVSSKDTNNSSIRGSKKNNDKVVENENNDNNNNNIDSNDSNKTDHDVIQNPMLIVDENAVDSQKSKQGATASASQTKEIVKQVIDNLSYVSHFGLKSLILILLLFLISIGQFVIFFVFANIPFDTTFQRINAPFVWLYLLLCCIYIVSILYIIVTWKYNAQQWVEETYALNDKDDNDDDNETTTTTIANSTFFFRCGV